MLSFYNDGTHATSTVTNNTGTVIAYKKFDAPKIKIKDDGNKDYKKLDKDTMYINKQVFKDIKKHCKENLLQQFLF